MSLRAAFGGRGLLVLAFLAPIGLRALSFEDSLLDRDEAYWLAAAMRMRDEGMPPYLGGWDMKPPLVFLLFRLAVAIAPGAPLLAAHVLTAVVAGTACALVASAARRLAGDLAGAAALAAFALLDATGPVKGLAANTEVLTYVPVAALAACLVAAERGGRPGGTRLAVAVGACGALAGLAKQPAALFLPCGAVATLLVRGGPGFNRTALGAAAGAGLVLAATALWLAATGAWDDAVACLWTITQQRAAAATDLAEAPGYARWLGVAAANAGVLIGTAAAVVCAARGDDAARATPRAALRLVGPLLVAGAFAALAGGAAFLHYLRLAYVPAALLAGVGIAVAYARLGSSHRRAVATVAVFVVAAAGALSDRRVQWRSRKWTRYDGPDVLAVAERVRALVPEDGRLFVWGMHPDLYAIARRTPATRFTATCWLVGTFTGAPPPGDPAPREFVPGSWDLLFADLDARPPEAIVDSAPAGVHGFDAYPVARFERLRAWIDERYVEEPPGPGGHRLWRRR